MTPTDVSTPEAETDASAAPDSGIPKPGEDSPRVTEDMAFTVSGDGTILNIVQAPESRAEQFAEIAGASLTDLLPASAAERIRTVARSTLRSRRFACERIADGESDIEFTAIPQGRDRVLVLLRDVSEHSHAIAQMQDLAYRDEVTNLPNARFLTRELDRILGDTALTEGRVALICFHIDQVTSNGMTYDPRRIETVLREIAARLTRELRGVNDRQPLTYERYSAAARMDFREFAVVLPSIESGSDAEAVTKRLLESLRQPIDVGDGSIRVGVRAGIAMFPQDGRSAETLIDNAIAAMQDARSSDVEDFKFYSGTARLRALQRKDIEVQMQSALDAEEFDIHYQPIVEAGTRKPVALEALLRWPTTLVATRSIERIIALAEHTGLMVPIGEWVLRNACTQLAKLQRAGHDGLSLAINLSVLEFSNPALANTVRAVLDASGVAPECIEFEITEYLLFRDSMKQYEACHALKDLGVRLTIDDFGTGACSLAHVAHAPIDALKLAAGFVEQAVASDPDRRACAASIRLAESLGLAVVASGVETDEQAALLAEFGCSRLQGFLYSRPVAGDALPTLLDPDGDLNYKVGRRG